MSVTDYPVEESSIAFDFSKARQCIRHELVNTAFKGVDFIIEEDERRIWLEVKNWRGANIPPARRGGQAQSFLAKMRGKQSSAFFKETMRGKFISTLAYFALHRVNLSKPILYIALLEAGPMDALLMGTTTIRLRSLVRAGRWPVEVEAVVLNLAEWNARFPEYPAQAL